MVNKSKTIISRRAALKAGAAAAVVLGSPSILKQARGETPIKIGIPTVITGTYAEYGSHVVRTSKLVEKEVNDKGGLLGRPIKFLYEDTQGDPKNCLRKTQELVERDGIKLFTGVVVSSEARAIMPKLPEWDALFISHGNGDGRLTTPKFLVPNFFRANTSAPMGSRSLSLFLKESEAKSFFAIASDYSWGHSSVASFEKQIQGVGKKFAGKTFAPQGNKDYSTYITKIMQSGADACFVALGGDEVRAFYSQAVQYRLASKMKIVTSMIGQSVLTTLGKDSIGIVGASRYPYTLDNPENKAFVKQFIAANKVFPDWTDGELYQATHSMFAAIEKAGSLDTQKIISALEGLDVKSVKGDIHFRECDHQAENPGFVVEIKAGSDGNPEPQIQSVFNKKRATPDCGKTTFSS
jgi:branched-chain amino acid transport system substrate-binding protein